MRLQGKIEELKKSIEEVKENIKIEEQLLDKLEAEYGDEVMIY